MLRNELILDYDFEVFDIYLVIVVDYGFNVLIFVVWIIVLM